MKGNVKSSEASEVNSWVSVYPGGLLHVRRRRTQHRGHGDMSPRMGSMCQFRVREGTHRASASSGVPNLVPVQFARNPASILQVPLDTWLQLRLGEGQCDMTEECLAGMRAGETCELMVTILKDKLTVGEHNSVLEPSEWERLPDGSQHFTVELHSFSQGHESWEMSHEEKWGWVLAHKDVGGQRFRCGDLWGAGDCYSRALKLLLTMHGLLTQAERSEAESAVREEEWGESKQVLPPTEGQYRTVRTELHANLSLCQLKLGKWQEAKQSGSRATQQDPQNAKAWYRLGQACALLGETGEARAAFNKLLQLQPSSPAALKALREVEVQEKSADRRLGHRLSKMFT